VDTSGKTVRLAPGDDAEDHEGDRAIEARGWRVVFVLALGYVGIYLCRKNLSVAVPLLQRAFGATKAEVGTIASVGTVAYAAGKIIHGALVDRVGGRRGFLAAIVAVALFGAASALAPGLTWLTVLYGVNRFAGAAGWGAMVKIVPSWFSSARTGTVLGALSVSYVAGGILAVLLAREVLGAGGGWRAVMGVPSAFALAIAIVCAIFARSGPRQPGSASRGSRTPARRGGYRRLLENPQFLVTCVLSLTLTLMREAFGTWSIDFLVSINGGRESVATAALRSTGFDLAGFASVLLAGVAYDRVRPGLRRWLVFASLALLAAVIAALPRVAIANEAGGTLLVGVAGLLVYGPYSLLAGTLAVESAGAELVATAAGIIDGVGYVAGALAGTVLGGLLDLGGYALGFGVLAAITAVSAVIALGLRPMTGQPEAGA
jgi:sugar phosphate permease